MPRGRVSTRGTLAFLHGPGQKFTAAFAAFAILFHLSFSLPGQGLLGFVRSQIQNYRLMEINHRAIPRPPIRVRTTSTTFAVLFVLLFIVLPFRLSVSFTCMLIVYVMTNSLSTVFPENFKNIFYFLNSF